MKNLMLLLFLLSSTAVMSQKYLYLEDIKLKKKVHFEDNEKNVIKAANYLLSSSISKKNLDRQVCIRFLLNFATKTPTASITINEYVSKLYKKNDDLLGMYIGIWLMETIETPGKSDEYYQIATLEKIYTYTINDHGVKKTGFINDLIAAGDNKEIDIFLKKLLKAE